MKRIRVLLIEDDAVDREVFERAVRDQNLPYQVSTAASLAEARQLLGREAFEIVVTDYQLGDGTAFDVLELKLDAQVVVTTGAGDEEVAVKAMKAGAWDYLIKDPEGRYLRILPVTLDRAIERKRTELRYRILSERERAAATLVGGPGLAETMRLVDLAAASDSAVFITGETGTGKSLLARTIHERSAQRSAPFISINCAAIPEQLIEGELFGYEKGAFTGAVSQKKGIFEMAEGGTLLLDELGEMPLHLQSKLLGVLDDRKVRRLGSESVRQVDVRVITSTNVDLAQALGKTFRADLYYRLSVVRIDVPPLRDRAGELPALCAHLLGTLAGVGTGALAEGEIERLQRYPWPGNVRELRNLLERSLILHRGEPLRPSELVGAVAPAGPPPASSGDPEPAAFRTLAEVEAEHLRAGLDRYSGNIMRTARALGISVSTLKRKVKELGYTREAQSPR